jgi:hypothetical protein
MTNTFKKIMFKMAYYTYIRGLIQEKIDDPKSTTDEEVLQAIDNLVESLLAEEG